MKVYLMLDVGGTNIKAGILSETGTLYEDKITVFQAKSKGNKEEIFDNFVEILTTLIEKIPQENRQIAGIGMAFPGPFDYKRGISMMKGLGKYDAIYGIEISKEIKKRFLTSKHADCLLANCKFVFLHDVEAFAAGECYFGQARVCEKVMYLCMGTGAGSAFSQGKTILKKDKRVPENGWIFNTSFMESIIDDYLSVRGLAALSKKILGEEKSGLELYLLSQQNDQEALDVYRQFGNWVKNAIVPFLDSFCPDGIVLGGQLSKSFSYFGEALTEACNERDVRIYLTEDTSRRALEGLYIEMTREKSV